jgi:hypothetical protein
MKPSAHSRTRRSFKRQAKNGKHGLGRKAEMQVEPASFLGMLTPRDYAIGVAKMKGAQESSIEGMASAANPSIASRPS